MLRLIAPPSATPIQFNAKLHNPLKSNHPLNTIPRKPLHPSNLTLTKTHSSNSTSQFAIHSEKPSENDWEFLEEVGEDDDEGCPWEGAITYKRNAAVSHLEYCTTLERLGLQKVSSEVSKSRASEMGLRVVRPVKDYPDGTPKLRLDGIVRTVIGLNCNRCGEPAAQSVYSDFSLLLCEEPIQEPETINFGVIFGKDKSKTIADYDDDEDGLIDFDDQLYFPVDKKSIDISKNIRDLIHVEITISAVCDASCKGLCLKCGTNLNTGKCTCNNNRQKVQEKGFGPLGDLRKQMQQT
ncbi:hypothetical protein PHJA_001042400 [Phtheirospermum japonicum]|uniref:Large ribosomal RNA subunit accumulation protein YCED homolog 1, chloroplastic n=1 Tax=Phtheirospermum japonicum TaxID=374723 RepID=A0A830BN29_9LAMI|nr:hypothetical protein PHJA_001042400 [Phtheirospermum japonicum]